MSIVMTRDVFCDGIYPNGNRCSCWAHDQGSTHSADEARANARAVGWRRVRGRDLCPTCAERPNERVPQ